MLKNIDLNLLVVFEAVYSAGNISHAAVQLGMSQPAVSNALTRLRDIVGDPLFVRARRGVDPTGKAEAMIGPVREALSVIGQQFQTDGDIDLSTYRRTFRIVVLDPMEPLMMPHVLDIIDRQAPGIQVESISPYGMDFAAEILAGRLDLAIYVYPIEAPQMVALPVGSVDPVVVARRGHPGLSGTLTRENFESLGHVVLVPPLRGLAHVQKDLVAQGMKRRIVYAVAKIWSMPGIVQRTDLIATLPRHFAEEVSRSFDLEIYEPPVPMSAQYHYMMWHEKSTDDPGHRWLRETLLASLGRPAQGDNVIPLERPAALARQARNAGLPTRPRPAS